MTSQSEIHAGMQAAGDRLYKAFQSYHNHNNSYSSINDNDNKQATTSQIDNKIASNPDSDSNSKHLLYDPSTLTQTENYKILHSRPQLLSAEVPATFNGHNSLEILAALTDHASKMSKVENEFQSHKGKSESQFHGLDSEELTKAFVQYAKTHDGLPKDYLDSLKSDKSKSSSSTLGAADNSFKLASGSAVGAGAYSKESATIGGTIVSSSVFSRE